MLLNFINEVVNFDKTVIRNTPILKSSVDEFDDLVDDSFDRDFAHRFIQKNNPPAAEIIKNHAIDYVFSQNILPPSRFSDGTFPAWYASLDPVTTFYETCHHWLNDFLRDIHFSSKKNIFQERSLFSTECNSILIDLRNKTNHVPELIHQHVSSYETTQALGKTLYQQGNPGIYTLSARNKNGENIVIYNRNVISKATLLNNVVYEFSPVDAKITVRELETDAVLLIL
jgi:hypothetical protein